MERLQKWAHVAEITGAIAVVVSLLYVGIQIRENTDAQLSQTEMNLFSLGFQLDEWHMDPAFVAIVAKGEADYDALTELERRQFDRHVGMTLNLWAYAWKSHVRGQIDDEEWRAWDSWARAELEKPSWQTVYARIRHGYHLDFQRHLDAGNSRR